MNPYRERFGTSKRIFPVVHIATLNVELALANARCAVNAGADGIFLINHGIPSDDLLFSIYPRIRTAFPNLWIGINCLDRTPMGALCAILDIGINGLWTDNCGAGTPAEEREAQMVFRLVQRELHSKGDIYFGGTAFKYQPSSLAPYQAAQHALSLTDVITTSGDGTGEAPAVEKIKSMREASGDFPLAIASGISPNNLAEFLPFADAFLVATAISKNFHELDPKKTKQLVKARDRSST